jgi:TRAP-type C4-dicarboxylate transport system permease small subunit
MRWAVHEGRLVKFLLVLGSLAVLAMMIIVSFNIFGRWLFSPILGALEIAGLCGAVVAAVGIPYAAREKRNVVVDVIASRMPPRVRGFFDAVSFTIGLAIAGFLVYVAFSEVRYAASFGEETMVSETPTTPFKCIWAIGLLLLFLVLAREVVRAIRKAAKR